ncbi:galactose mutarotase [Candidatus Woesearchaeota archaeon]|nr:galactose mutarotase [Candidatus Woesearchaeota archaeon]
MGMILKEVSLDNFEGAVSNGVVRNIRMQNSNWMEVLLTNYGPTVLEIKIPDKESKLISVLLGYPTLAGYVSDPSYQGRIAVGRVANRIGNAQYKQPDYTHAAPDGIVKLLANNGEHTLHGGPEGWSSKVWDVGDSYKSNDKASISFGLLSEHLEQGFPGKVHARVIVTLTNNNELIFEYVAITGRTTPINPTMHGYFNLEGLDATVHKHLLRTNADRYLVVDGTLIPTGEILSVEGTRYDFRKEKEIGKDFGKEGYDNCFVFPKSNAGSWVRVVSPKTNIAMTMDTDQPAVQLYTSFFLGKPFKQFSGFCLEAQQLVNAVNNQKWWSEFGNPFTKPSEPYKQRTVYKFDMI